MPKHRITTHRIISHRIVSIAVLSAIATFGCLLRRNANYCEGRNADNNCSEPPYPPDGSVDAPPAPCQSSANCAAPAGVCDLSGGNGSGKCVMCTAQDHSACTGNTCGSDHLCHPCSAHNQCDSQVCLPSGECSAENATNVAYVAPAGSGTACTKAVPCASLTTAFGTGRAYIKVTGTIQENVEANGNTATILADAGAKLVPKTNGILLEVKSHSSLTIYDLEMSGAQGAAGDGIYMPRDNQSTVTLHHVKILSNTGAGINADGGTLNIFQSTIAENAGGGINMNSPTTFEIRNNFIVRNGTSISRVGGLFADAAGGSKLEFNTIVDNQAGSAQSQTGGVNCVNSAAQFNIVAGNIRIAGFSDPQVYGNCNFSDSLVAASSTVANFAPNDYHLTANSPAGAVPGAIRDVVTCSDTSKLVDIDGENRPKNGKCDLGADEY